MFPTTPKKKQIEQSQQIKQIMSQKYTKVKSINLSEMKLKIIDFLQWIPLQNMTAINLQGNLIHSIQPLNRLFIPNLKSIWLGANPICQADLLQKVRIESNWIDIRLNQTKIQSNNWLFKIQPTPDSYIFVPPSVQRDGFLKSRIDLFKQNRIRSNRIEKMLYEQRFINIILICSRQDQWTNHVFAKHLRFGVRLR